MPIRAATPEDLEAIEAIVAAAYAKWVPRIGVRPRPMDDDYATVMREFDVVVAERGGEVVGLLVLRAEPDHLLIENVAVAPPQQGKGIGGELLEHAEVEARAHALDRLLLYTHEKMAENIAIYRRRGYQESERGTQEGFPRVFMEKFL
jgi:ribosomal protein S18 acetylase RimI-like enzyme